MKKEEYWLKFRDLNPFSFITYFLRNKPRISKERRLKDYGISGGATKRHDFLLAYNSLLWAGLALKSLEKIMQ